MFNPPFVLQTSTLARLSLVKMVDLAPWGITAIPNLNLKIQKKSYIACIIILSCVVCTLHHILYWLAAG